MAFRKREFLMVRKQLALLIAAVTVGTIIGGCAEPVEDINRVQPNALSKSLFQGEWYFAKTVVDAPYETGSTFAGDRQEYLLARRLPCVQDSLAYRRAILIRVPC